MKYIHAQAKPHAPRAGEIISHTTDRSRDGGWSQRYERVPQRWIGRCRDCKAGHSRLFVASINSGGPGYQNLNLWETDAGEFVEEGRSTWSPTVRCQCGRAVVLRPVLGVYNPDKKCSARCMNATGPSCECSCAGKNHGAAFG